jgi:hypothetical protein
MTSPTAFDSELLRWLNVWRKQPTVPITVTSLLVKHADELFFPNVRELLKVPISLIFL